MAAYLANQIILGKLTYNAVIIRKPELKTEIDKILIENSKGDLIQSNL